MADDLFVGRTDRTMEQTAVFGDVIWRFNDKLEGTLGGRWFSFDHENAYSGNGLLNGGPSFEQSAADETGFTPKFGLTYFHSRDVTLYGVIANGYRPGGTNDPSAEDFPGCGEDLEDLGLDGIPRAYESDSLWSYELGLKSNWAGQKVFLNTAIYYIDWSDIQTFTSIPCGAAWQENAGKAISQGIELELAAYPISNLGLTFNGTYTDAKLDEDVPNLGGVEGEEMPGVPEYTFGGSITWFFDAFEGVTGSVRADYQYVGESWNYYSSFRLQTPSHSLTNLRLNLHKGRWQGSLFINNLFDNRAVVTVNSNFFADYVTTARPFTFGVSGRYSY